MTERSDLARRELLGILVAAVAGVESCHLIFPFESEDVGSTYVCDAKIREYARTYPAPDPADQITVHGVGTAEQVPFYNSEPGVLPNLYPNVAWKPTAEGLPWQLKGTHLIRVSSANADSKADVFLDVALQNDVQELIIAFDTRATTPPTWLAGSQKFERIPGTVLRSTQKYAPPGGGQARNVEYALWHPTREHQGELTRTFSLGGNDAPGAVWDGGRVGSQYLAFLRPRPWLDKSKIQDLDAVHVEVCGKPGDTAQTILQAAEAGEDEILSAWIGDLEERDRPSHAQAQSDGALDVVYDPAKPCAATTDAPAHPKTYKVCFEEADEIGSAKKPLTSWLLRSRATIDPGASSITVHTRGTTTKGAIRGRVSFRITAENDAQIGELTLFTDALSASGIAVEELSLGQAKTLVAKCTDSPPPGPSRLCKDYAIPAGSAATQVGAKLDGSPVYVPLENAQPVPVHVDFNSRTFAMSGGPLLGELPVDGDRELVELWLTVTGRFENLAPVASTKEMQLEFECVDQSRGSVHLDASASFDEDPGPGIVAYQWLEDAGLPTQRTLGTAKTLDLVMNFGGHPVTLVVTDDRGAIGRKSVLIDVFDRRLDGYHPPDDVFAAAEDRHGAVVAIGAATASDDCSGTVLISNDAPADLAFPRGVSTVEWTFDDCHGNVVQHEQRIVVVDSIYFPPPIATGYVLSAVSADGTPEVVYLYGTQGQGKRVRADEHVLVRSPAGRVYAVDAAGRLVAPEKGRALRGARRTFGKEPTQGFVALRAGAGPLGEDGRYALSYVVTVPGGSPENPHDVLARHDAEVELRRP